MLHCCRSTPLPATLIVTATDSIASDFDRAPARIWVSCVGVAPYGAGRGWPGGRRWVFGWRRRESAGLESDHRVRSGQPRRHPLGRGRPDRYPRHQPPAATEPSLTHAAVGPLPATRESGDGGRRLATGHLAAVEVIAGITAALTVGSVNPDVVAVEARKAAQQSRIEPEIPGAKTGGDDVVSLTGRRTAAQLPGDARPLPTVDKYDELLRGAGSS